MPEYWIVNLGDMTIEVHTGPGREQYERRIVQPRDAALRIGAFPDVEVRFGEILDGL